jgi:GNAT superfamily N-acetyltransferase
VAEDPGWSIELLRRAHDRSDFDCGNPLLDGFIRAYASQNERVGTSRTFVAVHPGSDRVCGYYSIAAGSLVLQSIPKHSRQHLVRQPIPIALLGRLAVDRSEQGKGLGKIMLADALTRIVAAADSIGIHAIEVHAIDSTARSFYERFGFTGLLDHPLHLYLPISRARAAARE